MKFEKVKIASRNELVNLLEKFDAELFDYDIKCLMFKLRVFEWKQNDKIAFVFYTINPNNHLPVDKMRFRILMREQIFRIQKFI